MKSIFALTLGVLLLMVSPGAAQPPETAVIKKASGSVQVLREDKTLKGRPSFPLQEKDVVTTGPSGFAGILFRDGTVITLGPSSEFRIQNYIFEPRDHVYFFNFYMNKGSLIYNSGQIGKLSPKSVRLTTPEASVGIRGTRFIVEFK